ncbi:MAG: DUF4157 domain-containing protein [Pyrinomonadaceae bacterium]|nr:DUF4157 domain-containing protein [Pyrinomonadaceae bacterium]
MGNQRIAQLIRAKRLTPQGKILGLRVQLSVGAATDQYEQEADGVARQVQSMSDAAAQRQIRKDNAASKSIHAKFGGSPADSFEAGSDIEAQLNLSQGYGSSLPEPVRAYMEPRFGVDFSQVRVDRDSDAIQMNRDVGAQAFTHGSDIYFGEGRSPGDLELTAHELTHSIQQSPRMQRHVLNLQSIHSEHDQSEQGSAMVQRKLRKRDEKIKTEFDQLVMDGKHDEALDLICKKYGFKGKNFEIKLVPPMADSWATTGGEIKAGAKQTLSIGKDLLDQDFTFIIRTIGHEFQHLEQRSQKKPIENQKEREFLAWSWEALDTDVPSYSLLVAAEHAKSALEFYDAMPDERKELSSNKKKKKALDKLIKKSEAAATP